MNKNNKPGAIKILDKAIAILAQYMPLADKIGLMSPDLRVVQDLNHHRFVIVQFPARTLPVVGHAKQRDGPNGLRDEGSGQRVLGISGVNGGHRRQRAINGFHPLRGRQFLVEEHLDVLPAFVLHHKRKARGMMIVLADLVRRGHSGDPADPTQDYTCKLTTTSPNYLLLVIN